MSAKAHTYIPKDIRTMTNHKHFWPGDLKEYEHSHKRGAVPHGHHGSKYGGIMEDYNHDAGCNLTLLDEAKRKPDASDVRDTLITGFCQECPDHDDDECHDHGCFIWEIFGALMEAEK